MVSLINGIIGIVAGSITVITTYYVILKYIYAPKFIIGVLPIPLNQKIGRHSSVDEFDFDKTILARRYKRNSDLEKIKNDLKKSRSYQNRKNIKLPIIIQNTGKREADRYKIVISFSEPNVNIVDFDSETLSIDGLFAEKNNLLKKESLQNKNVPPKIRKCWDEIGLTSDYISLVGSIASKASEMILLEVEVPNADDFFIFFRIDSPSIFAKRMIFSQHIKVS